VSAHPARISEVVLPEAFTATYKAYSAAKNVPEKRTNSSGARQVAMRETGFEPATFGSGGAGSRARHSQPAAAGSRRITV
jgi:hypothetical protein